MEKERFNKNIYSTWGNSSIIKISWCDISSLIWLSIVSSWTNDDNALPNEKNYVNNKSITKGTDPLNQAHKYNI